MSCIDKKNWYSLPDKELDDSDFSELYHYGRLGQVRLSKFQWNLENLHVSKPTSLTQPLEKKKRESIFKEILGFIRTYARLFNLFKSRSSDLLSVSCFSSSINIKHSSSRK